MNYRKRRQNKARIYVRLIPSRECLCSEFSLAQQKRTKEGLGPVLAGQRGSAHRTDMKLSGFIRQDRGTQGDDGNSTRPLPRSTPQAVRSKNTQVEKNLQSRSFIQRNEISGHQQFLHRLPECVCACTDVTEDHFVVETFNIVSSVNVFVWLVFSMALGYVLFCSF